MLPFLFVFILLEVKMMDEIKFSITKLRDVNNMIAKKINLVDGKLVKHSKVAVYDGTSHTSTHNLTSFYEYLTNIPNDECILLGYNKHSSTSLIVSGAENEDIMSNMFCRSKSNYIFGDEYQLVYFDYDESSGGNMTPEEFIEVLDTIMPGFKDVSKIIKYSSSAHIYHEETLLSRFNGFHIYFLVNNPHLIEKCFSGITSRLQQRLILAGYGHIKNTKPRDREITIIKPLLRTIIDSAVFSPERIIFESNPILGKGLTKTNIDPILYLGKYNFMDIKSIKPIQPSEIERVDKVIEDLLVKNLEDPYVVESKKMFVGKMKKEIGTPEYIRKNPHHIGLTDHEIMTAIIKDRQSGVLHPDTMIYLSNKQVVDVREILNNPTMYHKKKCKDPNEPDYSKNYIGMIYSNQDNPIIYSHAHGGMTYKLKGVVK